VTSSVRRPPLACRLGAGLAGVLLGCGTHAFVVGKTPRSQDIVEIATPLSNAYLVRCDPPILIDSGANGDYDAVASALREYGTAPERVRLVILTHGHADHAASAAQFQRMHAQIMLGQGDVPLALHGQNDELRPMYFTASMLKLFLPSTYPPFHPDVVVQAPLDLAPWGLDGSVEQMPGHTAGSLVVVLANHAAFVGDMLLGGSLGGALSPANPSEHYFHADPGANADNLKRLLARGVEKFYLGHGGPVTRDAVIEAFDLSASAGATSPARGRLSEAASARASELEREPWGRAASLR
jgi:glyoxylase-like metal-dependent hydrolase (beta-lactamase superfamily II)